jgi:hypothetical protein
MQTTVIKFTVFMTLLPAVGTPPPLLEFSPK